MAQLKNITKSQILAKNVREARSLWSRTKGLIGSDTLPKEETLWISYCNSIHTFFMKYPIDVIFVDKNLRIKQVKFNVRPWSVLLPVWGATSVFEFESGKLDFTNLEVGDQLHVGN